jgi:hypothetical protein
MEARRQVIGAIPAVHALPLIAILQCPVPSSADMLDSQVDPCATVQCVPSDRQFASNTARITSGRGHHPLVCRDARALTLRVPARTIRRPAAAALWPRSGHRSAMPTWPHSSRSHQRPHNLHTQQLDGFHDDTSTAMCNSAIITLSQCS